MPTYFTFKIKIMRKNKLFRIAMFAVMGTMAMTLFTSCDDNEDVVVETALESPNVKFTLDNFVNYVGNGEYLALDGVAIDTANSSEGVSIKSVDYYFDKELISSSSTSPFSLRYFIQDKSVGRHRLTLAIKVDGGYNYSDTTCTLNYNVYVLEKAVSTDSQSNI